MNHSNELTQLELILLQLVAKGEGKWSWYEIAQALSRLDVPREPDMMEVLKKLAAEGFLTREVQPGSPRDRWELTQAGKKRLSDAKAGRTRRTIGDVSRSISAESIPTIEYSGSQLSGNVKKR
ncbi:helix-turn-helix transcriptional regulator [Oscillatoria sp. HE19RPO]|uniref:helix-turn-helix transcriptional regulator n=1 Tax=Oscillatoria sp. HE19RPO TaxID=2954806 RepID=UPI0020C2C465|nr:helix-turn-helix transcriptional regulator [Oscillatoria sp. HE19RPO]